MGRKSQEIIVAIAIAAIAACGSLEIEPGPDVFITLSADAAHAPLDAGAPVDAAHAPDSLAPADAPPAAPVDAAHAPECDPLEQACGDFLGCYMGTAGSVCVTAGPYGPGDPCAAMNECEAGAGCYSLADSSICFAYCDHDRYPLMHDPRCETGELCVSIGPMDRIGICL